MKPIDPDPDAERWRFLADHKLSLQHTARGEALVNLVQCRGTGEPKVLPVAVGPTADAAIDSARARYEYGLGNSNHPKSSERL